MSSDHMDFSMMMLMLEVSARFVFIICVLPRLRDSSMPTDRPSTTDYLGYGTPKRLESLILGPEIGLMIFKKSIAGVGG